MQARAATFMHSGPVRCRARNTRVMRTCPVLAAVMGSQPDPGATCAMRAALLALLLLPAWPALAQQREADASSVRPAAWFVNVGASRHDTLVTGLGLHWPLRWQSQRWSTALDFSVNRWQTNLEQGDNATTQLALVPMLRWQPQGGSRWFLEGGIGLSLHDIHYRREGARMSTKWNFHDVLAAGLRLQGGQELSLRLVHVSNGGVSKPNPGEDLLLLRWSSPF